MPRPGSAPLSDELRGALHRAGFTDLEARGRGGSGQVIRAVAGDGRARAVKLLDHSADAARLEREAAAIEQLDHSGLPRHVEIIDLDGRLAMVTDWVDGATVAEQLADGRPAPAQVLGIFDGLASALDHLHDRGLVHRDVSPGNVIVDQDGRVTLIDFGLSRGSASATVTADNHTAGTPRYMAPEVLAGEPASPRSDQYSAAVMLYELLTGAWPYPDPGDTIATTMHHHLHSEVVPVSEVDGLLSPRLDPVLARGLARDPSARFDSVGDMVAALRTASAAPSRGGGRTRFGAGMAARVAALGVVVIAAVAGIGAARGWFTGDDDAEWVSGDARALECNLLAQPDFDIGPRPTSFYDPVDDQNEVVDGRGLGSTAALAVGVRGDFGLYGELVPIEGGRTYVFAAHVEPTADTQGAWLRFYTLDAEYELITDDPGSDIGRDEVDLALGAGPLRQERVIMTASPEAAFAVPTLLKEGPDGALFADELVVADAASACGAAVAAS